MTSKRENQALKRSKEWINPQFLNGQGDKFFANIPCKKWSQLSLLLKAAKYLINLSIDLAASGDRASLINCQRALPISSSLGYKPRWDINGLNYNNFT